MMRPLPRQMKRAIAITTLFLDVGGVLLTNGWGHQSRALAAKAFALNLDEMEDRHHLTFDTYEVGKLTLEEYLTRTVFYEERPFTREQFREFMFAQVAESLGIRGIRHADYQSTCETLVSFGLQNVASEKTRPRSAPGFAMGWDSLESNSKKSETRPVRA